MLARATQVAGVHGLADAIEEAGLRCGPAVLANRPGRVAPAPAASVEQWTAAPTSTMAIPRFLAPLVTGEHTGLTGHSQVADWMLDTPEVACTFCGFKSEEPHVASTPSGPRARPPAGRFTPELVRWCQKEGPLIVFSNEVQRYWMKPN